MRTMSCKFICVSASILFCQIFISFSIVLQHPSLCVSSHRTVEFSADKFHRPNNWNQAPLSNEPRQKRTKNSWEIQNIDGTTLLFDRNMKSFSLTSETDSKSKRNKKMMILTLNFKKPTQSNNGRKRNSKEIIRRYIQMDGPDGGHYVLIRAQHWPYYLCNDRNNSVYGSVIQNGVLSHNCVWYMRLTSSGYITFVKTVTVRLGNITYHDNIALTSYRTENLNISIYNEKLENSFHWAITLSHSTIPRSTSPQSIFFQFPDQSSKIKSILDQLKGSKKTRIPTICLELDRKIYKQINTKNRLHNQINKIRFSLTKLYANLSISFDRFIKLLLIIYKFEIDLWFNQGKLSFFQKIQSNFLNETLVKINSIDKSLKRTRSLLNVVKCEICREIIKPNTTLCSCICLRTDGNDSFNSTVKSLCRKFRFNQLIVAHFSVWSQLPSPSQLFLASQYQKRYQNTTSIREKRKAYFNFNPKLSSYSTDFIRSKMCF